MWPRSQRSWRLLQVVLLAVLVGACSRSRRRDRDPVAVPLRVAERHLAARASASELDRAIELLSGLMVKHPRDPRVLGMLARALTYRGYGIPDSDRDDLRRAREVGLACLTLSPAFSAAVEGEGRRITPEAVSALDTAEGECLVWATHAWLRWLQERGTGGATFDLPVLEAMAERSVELTPSRWRTEATINQVLALGLVPPGQAAPFTEVEAAFERAMALAPARLDLLVDRAELVAAPQGDEASWSQLLREVGDATPSEAVDVVLENRRAKERAAVRLEQGPPRPVVVVERLERSSTNAPKPDTSRREGGKGAGEQQGR